MSLLTDFALTLWVLYGDICIPANFGHQGSVVVVRTAVVAPVVALVVLVPVPVVVLTDVGVPVLQGDVVLAGPVRVRGGYDGSPLVVLGPNSIVNI